MKYIITLITVLLLLSCKTNEETQFFEIKLTEKSVVGISPDSLQVIGMKKEYGEEDFYTATDDIMWYQGQMLQVIDSLKINYVSTNKRLVKITTPKDVLEIDNDTSQFKWRYFYFNGEETLEKDVFEIIDFSKKQF